MDLFSQSFSQSDSKYFCNAYYVLETTIGAKDKG